LLTISSTKESLHFVSITIIVFLHTFFGLAQFFKKPCNPVFNVLQFFKKKWGTLPPLVKRVYIWFDNRWGGFVTFSHNHPNTGMNVLTHLFRVSKAMDELGRLRWKWRYLDEWTHPFWKLQGKWMNFGDGDVWMNKPTHFWNYRVSGWILEMEIFGWINPPIFETTR
jgi:hypothetical protein